MPYLRLARQIFLKLLLAYVLLAGAVTLYRWVLLHALQPALGLDDAATSLLRRGGVLLSALLAYVVYVRLAEKRRAIELHLAPSGIAIGTVSGALLVSLPLFVLFALGAYEAVAWRGLQSGLFGVACVILVAAVLEELVFRGIVFRVLEDALGSLPALWLQSLVFAVLHIANIDDRASTMELVTTVASVTMVGALWTLIFIHSRNIWVAGTNHAAWNFVIVLSGAPLSGLEDWRELAPIATDVSGPGWLTGGVFGPESSPVTLLVVGLSLAALLRRARARQRLVLGMTGQRTPTAPAPVPAASA